MPLMNFFYLCYQSQVVFVATAKVLDCKRLEYSEALTEYEASEVRGLGSFDRTLDCRKCSVRHSVEMHS